MMKGALHGIKVLDLTRFLSGPFCTMMLGDMGADIIKIEVPEKGDDSRVFRPAKNGEGGYFMNVNRNKRGVTLNLKAPEGKQIFLDMLKDADIVVENYRPGVMERLGLGYEQLKAYKPDIIYGCISGFGHYGPYTERPGFDVIGQAMSGLMSITGFPENGPTRVGCAMVDTLSGLNLTIGLLGALNHRNQTGEGQKVDVSLQDAAIASMQIIHPIYTIDGQNPAQIGNRYESNYPTDTFRAKDGMYVIGASNNKLWHNMCKVMNNEEMETTYATNPERIAHYKEVKAIIEEWSKDKCVKDIVDALLAEGVPAAPIYNFEQVVNDPHVQAREMFVRVEHPVAGETLLTGSPLKFSGTAVQYGRPSPTLGQHNEEVYAQIGLDTNKLQELHEKGVI